MAPVLRTEAQVPPSNVLLVDAFGTRSAGVYLGNGVVLTSWQNVVGERYLWDVETLQAPSLAIQVPAVPVQTLTNPLDGFICQDETGFYYSVTGDMDACHPYDLTREMGVLVAGRDVDLAVEKLLYADRESDVALLVVHAPALEAVGVQAAPLSAHILQSGQPLVLADAQATVAVDQNMTIRNQPAHGIFDGSQQQSPVIPIEVPEERLPIGTPFYDERGGVVGLYWGRDEFAYLTPTAAWYHDLWQANTILQNAALTTILNEALVPDKVGGTPYIDPIFSSEIGNTGYDVLHYDLALSINPSDQSVSGRAILTMKATYHHLAAFTLDFSVMEATAVMVDGVAVPFTQQNAKLAITLDIAVDFGTVFEVEVTYGGIARAIDTPYSNSFQVGAEIEEDPPRIAFANQPDGAHTWYPCNDFPTDRATYDFHVQVPMGYMGVANGTLVATEQDDKSATFHWQMRVPMASNLSIVAVADYERIDDITSGGIPLQHFAYRGTADDVADVLSTTDMAFTLLEPFFGAYLFETYGHVVTPLPDGAIETQTMTMLPTNTDYSSPDLFFSLVVHELAHHWYGNSVTLGSWRDIWLNEGFATYAEWLAKGEIGGESELIRTLTRDENTVIASRRDTPLAYPQQNEVFGRDSYIKGAWVLHMLRLRVGDDVFFPMIQTWARSSLPATTLDFFRFAEQFSDQDLTIFRRQWLQSSGVPTYTIGWHYTDQILTIRPCNRRDVPYVLNMRLQITAIDGTITETTFVLRDDEVVSIALESLPVDLQLDPAQEVLGVFNTQQVTDTSSCLFLIE